MLLSWASAWLSGQQLKCTGLVSAASGEGDARGVERTAPGKLFGFEGKSNLRASYFLILSSGLMAPREVLTGNGECGPRKIELVSPHYKGGPLFLRVADS